MLILHEVSGSEALCKGSSCRAGSDAGSAEENTGSFNTEVFLDKLQTWAICRGIESVKAIM